MGDLFEHNDDAVRQIGWHQEFLAAFPSRGSSANNHVVAEAAGPAGRGLRVSLVLAAAPLAAERGRAAGARARGQHLRRRAQPRAGDRLPPLRPRARAGGRGRGRRRRHALSEATWARLTRMLDAAAAIVDVTGRPPRQGDGDEGRALVVDDPERDPWAAVLATGAAAAGRAGLVAAGSRRRAGIRCSPRSAGPGSPAATGRAATSVRGRRAWFCCGPARGRPGDLVPVRRRSPRLPVHRGPRPRRRPLVGGAARRRRHPRRPGHLLLPRRAGVAAVVPLDGGAQHHRDRRRRPVGVRRSVPVEHARPDDDAGCDVGTSRADLERRARRLPAA